MAKRDSTKSAGTTHDATRLEARAVLERYLTQLAGVHATGSGVPETSYYPALANLLDEVGKTLKPAVRCIMNLRQQGAGLPDGGLFTADQFRREADGDEKREQTPARGAIEAKAPSEDVRAVAQTKQVRAYLDRYGIVLVTNFREFLIVEHGPDDRPVPREWFSIAENEDDFWRRSVAHPRATAEQLGGQFLEFIKRACLHNAPLINPKDVAWFLASYARDALARVERRKDLPALLALRNSLEEALGMKFTDEQGEHFFRSTLVQTLFYGIFSAWVLWHREKRRTNESFDWRNAAWSLHVPFIRTLYEETAKPARLGDLELVEVLDWTGGVLNRVDAAEFFKRFQDEYAVQYFYEPFLEAYDPELRKALGVWYTPPEIVKYQVARVDTVLREELDLPDGLADPNVVILDPCCGTGAYLVEVLRVIEKNLSDNHNDALVAHDIKKAAMTRVFGFEILPAPFVIAHLQLGLLLQQAGVPLSVDRGERVGVYLTNALTGWEPPKEPKTQLPLPFPELKEERDAAQRVKREKRILVILGNPPYNAFAGVSPDEELGLVEPYKKDLNKPVAAGGWGIKKFNLDELYVRFFRLAERRVAEMTGRGVVSFISNHSWLSDPSFVVMRQHLLESFDKFWIESLHGNRKISEYAPDGRTSETIFAIRGFSVGIRQGVATSLWVKTGKSRSTPATVLFRDDIDAAKAEDRRKQLLATLQVRRFSSAFRRANSCRENRYSARPDNVADHYMKWPKLTDLCAIAPSNGLMEKRGGALIDIDRDKLEARMRDYFNTDYDWHEYKANSTTLTRNAARFNAKAARSKALKAEPFDAERICRYALRPFETRWCYFTPVRPIWNEPRPSLWAQFWKGNSFLMTRPAGVAAPEGVPFFFTRGLGDNDALRGHAYYVPFRLLNGVRLSKQQHATLFDMLGDQPGQDEPVANLSAAVREYLERLRIKNPDSDVKIAGSVWMHALAIGYSPAYLKDNADGIRRDWPRIPMPADRKRLQASAELGELLAGLLDTEVAVPEIRAGKTGSFFKSLGGIPKTGRSELDLSVTAGWGHAGKGGVTMPAKGRLVERNYSDDERSAIETEAKTRGISAADATRLLGPKTYDVYLNAAAYWRNIPLNVWEYRIGGYQVIKKWLSYREHALLGRPLTTEEAREVTDMVRRLAAIILLQPQLDENYRAAKDSAFDWSALSNE